MEKRGSYRAERKILEQKRMRWAIEDKVSRERTDSTTTSQRAREARRGRNVIFAKTLAIRAAIEKKVEGN